jgi:hypothetical protein
MTAIGFALAWISGSVALFTYEPTRSSNSQRLAFDVSLAVLAAGMVIVLLGVTVWLWGVMP